MIVGLLDWSLTRWRQPTVFSLDLMKLAHYHKTEKKDIVSMLYEYRQDQVEKMYISKDYEDYLYPELIVSDPRVEYIGLAMSGGKYQSLGEEIENRPADPSIYQGMLKYYERTTDSKRLFKNMLNATHMRISVDEKTISPFWRTQLPPRENNRVKHVILHDKEIGRVKHASDLLLELDNFYGRDKARLGFKFPISVYDNEGVLTWGQLTKSPGISNIMIKDMVDDYALEEVSIYRQQFTYDITGEYWTEERFIEKIAHIFLQGAFLARWNVPMQLRIEEGLLTHSLWYDFAELFNAYLRSSAMYRNSLVFSLFVFTKYVYLSLQRHEKIELFGFLQEFVPELFELAYHLEYVTFDGHDFIPHHYSWKEVSDFGGYGGYYYREGRKAEERKMLSEYNYAEVIAPEYLYLF